MGRGVRPGNPAKLGLIASFTPSGFLTVPRAEDGQPINPETFQQLPEDARTQFEEHARTVQKQAGRVARELRRLESKARTTVEALDRDAARFVVGPILDELRANHAQPSLIAHFNAIEKDILDNINVLKRSDAPPAATPGLPAAFAGAPSDPRGAIFRRYEVNLFVTHGEQPAAHAPVVNEEQPTYYNLFGRLDYQQRFGAMTTDFTMIRPGALHLANGGYLTLHAEDLLTDPRSWLKLKRSLRNKHVRVEDIGEAVTPFPVVNLIPEPIPLNVKVVLIGSPSVFALLESADPDFSDLFKIRAEFEPDTAVGDESVRSYVAFVRRSCDDCTLRHFTHDALIEIIRFGNRLAGRQDRLTARYGAVQDLCEEANQIAATDDAAAITEHHVQRALAAIDRRSDLVPDRIRRSIAEGSLHIAITGHVIGQLNGLAVFQIGGRAFGTPSRITCRTGAGTMGVVNIEREIARSGATHTKGVLILTGFLIGTFGRQHPLSFSASLTFEQSYNEIDGDSASSTELYAILSSLSRTPIRQGIAVTGSVDQFGNIQPVGGVTEKIEGFFDVCLQDGLTGEQGVMIPHPNRVSLTLRNDVAQAVEDGKFHIWAVKHIEQGIEIITGVPAGEPDAEGTYPEGTIFRRVVDALAAMRPAPPTPMTVPRFSPDSAGG